MPPVVPPAPFTRRSFLGGAAGCALSQPRHAFATPADPAAVAWEAFKAFFVQPEGRVVDVEQDGISHSEGQGIALLASAILGDQPAFKSILAWTRAHLSRPSDALHSWRYLPGNGNHVPDENNATDGDLLIGLALFIAADRWGGTYRDRGRAIARDVRTALLYSTNGGPVLLPGIAGFTRPDEVVVNPSYYVFPALRRFARDDPHPAWGALWNSGMRLLRQARFGTWMLPPDWLNLTPRGEVSMAKGWPARASFDAVRIPLYLCWAGMEAHPAVAAYMACWESNGGDTSPAWFDLQTGASAPFPISKGMDAIRCLALARCGVAEFSPLPITPGSLYYPSALTLLSHLAYRSLWARTPITT